MVAAVNARALKYAVVAADPDLAPLRSSAAFEAVQGTLTGAPAAVVPAALRAEARSPFRLLRLFLLGSLAGGAIIASVITLPRLAEAVSSGGDVVAPGGNAAVNAGVLATALYFLRRELAARAEDEAAAGREEALGALRVRAPLLASQQRGGTRATLPLRDLRTFRRPLIVFGDSRAVESAVREARGVEAALRARNVVLVCVPTGPPPASAAQGTAGLASGSGGGGARAKGFGPAALSPAADSPSDVPVSESSWRAEPDALPAWLRWAEASRLGLGVPEYAEEFHVMMGLDGVARRAGTGPVPWEALLAEIPVVDKAS